MNEKKINSLEQEIVGIGKKLLELRQKKGLTQEQVKTISGLTPRQIVQLEKGRTNFTVGSLISYLQAVDAQIVFAKNK